MVTLRSLYAGSPPRMRGKDPPGYRGRGPCRITPACAGKSRSLRMPGMACWDHPRVCGEKAACRTLSVGRKGITPACAGKRMVFAGLDHNTQDHPRVCGEKVHAQLTADVVIGSPPRMRGKALSKEETPIMDRITPAYAGKSEPACSQGMRPRDHPRVCGEKFARIKSD